MTPQLAIDVFKEELKPSNRSAEKRNGNASE